MNNRIVEVPILVIGCWKWSQRALYNAGETALVELLNATPRRLVFPQQSLGVNVGAETVHQDQRHINIMCLVQEFALFNTHVEEGLIVAHRYRAFGTITSHGRA